MWEGDVVGEVDTEILTQLLDIETNCASINKASVR
jgi:hypothetical protein